MRPLLTRNDIAAALQKEASGIPLEQLIDEARVQRRTFLKMRKRYIPLSDLLRDLTALQAENLHLKEMIAELAGEVFQPGCAPPINFPEK
jgi:putative transposase